MGIIRAHTWKTRGTKNLKMSINWEFAIECEVRGLMVQHRGRETINKVSGSLKGIRPIR